MIFGQKAVQKDIQPVWLPVFISLMIVLLSLTVFLVSFSETDPEKVSIFKKYIKESLMFSSREPAAGEVTGGDRKGALQVLINRMKSEGINKQLADNFLTVAQIKKITIRDGDEGITLILPDQVFFQGSGDRIDPKSALLLNEIMPMVMDLPYIVEIRGYSAGGEGRSFIDSLEFTSRRAYAVYNYFVKYGVAPEKLTVSGFGDSLKDPEKKSDRVEIVFKEQDY